MIQLSLRYELSVIRLAGYVTALHFTMGTINLVGYRGNMFPRFFIRGGQTTLLKKFKGANTLWQIAVKTDIPSFDTNI